MELEPLKNFIKTVHVLQIYGVRQYHTCTKTESACLAGGAVMTLAGCLFKLENEFFKMNRFCLFFLIIIKNSKFGCFISNYLSIMGCKRNNLIYYYCHKILFKLENAIFQNESFLLVFLDYY